MMKWIQVLECADKYSSKEDTASHATVVSHWIDWFAERGVACGMRRTPKGEALFRQMSDDQYTEFVRMNESVRSRSRP